MPKNGTKSTTTSQETLYSGFAFLFIRLITERCASGKADPVSESVSRYLALNFNEPELSLSKVLTDTGYNKDYVRRRFIAAYGVTPGQYLTNLRIENAKKLLRQRKES